MNCEQATTTPKFLLNLPISSDEATNFLSLLRQYIVENIHLVDAVVNELIFILYHNSKVLKFPASFSLRRVPSHSSFLVSVSVLLSSLLLLLIGESGGGNNSIENCLGHEGLNSLYSRYLMNINLTFSYKL